MAKFTSRNLMEAMELEVGDKLKVDGFTYYVVSYDTPQEDDCLYGLRKENSYDKNYPIDKLVGRYFEVISKNHPRTVGSVLPLQQTTHAYHSASDEGGCSEYEDWSDFVDNKKGYDLEMNYLYRFDIKKDEQTGKFDLEMHHAQQRHGQSLWHIVVHNIVEEDMPLITEYLQMCKGLVLDMWKEVTLIELNPQPILESKAKFRIGSMASLNGSPVDILDYQPFSYGNRYLVKDIEMDEFWVNEIQLDYNTDY